MEASGELFLEFFSLVIAQILKPEYGMFYVTNDYYFFNRCQFQDTEKGPVTPQNYILFMTSC